MLDFASCGEDDHEKHGRSEDALEKPKEVHPHIQAWSGNIMLWGCFPAKATG